MIDSYHCPRCSMPLDRSGTLAIGDDELPVFQCGQCTQDADMLGETFQVALTFVVRADGRAYDPASDQLIS